MSRTKRTITAIQPSATVPVAGGTIDVDVSKVAEVVIAIAGGTFAGFNGTFEGSFEPSGDNNWSTVRAVRSNANIIESTTGALSAVPAYAWIIPTSNIERLRIRATALTSGSPQLLIRTSKLSTMTIQAQDTQSVTATLTSTTMAAPAASIAGASFNHVVAAASNNAAVVKASAGRLLGYQFSNPTAAWKYVKLYNKATAPAPATDTPVMTIGIPPNGRASGEITIPLAFATGIGMAIVGGSANNDNTSVTAGDVIGSLFYV